MLKMQDATRFINIVLVSLLIIKLITKLKYSILKNLFYNLKFKLNKIYIESVIFLYKIERIWVFFVD